ASPTSLYSLPLHDALPIFQQVGTPESLYDNPANVFVAEFIGSPKMNLFKVPIESGEALLGNERIAIPNLDLSNHNEVILGLRPRSEEHTSELQSRFDLVCR